VELRIEELLLPLVHEFTISRSSESIAHTAVFRLRCDGLEGLGETAPVARYGESVASVRAYFAEHPVRGNDPFALEALLAGIPLAARCGLDVALHDLIGKLLDRPLWQLFGVDRDATPVTSFTIGLASLDDTMAKLEEIRDHPIVKLKLGGKNDVATVALVRGRYTGTLRVDANEAWSPEEAVKILRDIERYDVEFCEQPIPAGSAEGLRYVHERVGIPIVADEDACQARDVPRLQGCVDGVNVKLVKCGGLRAALAMIHTARALNLKVMLGCMVESAILATAAAHIAPLADWADLDGPFLTARDPYRGLSYDRGKLLLPDGPGLGVREAVRA
jgi:L-alanine-DL-glutamate epimerase-like enolase superfamily enzyme